MSLSKELEEIFEPTKDESYVKQIAKFNWHSLDQC